MITSHFVAIIKEGKGEIDRTESYQLTLEAKKFPARLLPGPRVEWLKPDESLVLVCLNRPVEVFWGKKLQVARRSDGLALAKGRVIDPSPGKMKQGWVSSPWLRLLAGKRPEMLLALCRRHGIRGVREQAATDFSGLSREVFLPLLEEMELKRQVRILSYEPLWFISQESLDFLASQGEGFLKRYHRQHPESRGVPFEKMRKRFRLPPFILRLILSRLRKEKKVVRIEGELISLESHEIPLEPGEDEILAALEDLCYQGEFRRVSLEEIQQRFRLSSHTLNKLLSHLTSKKKIIQGADGFYLHAHWLEEIIQKLRRLPKREVTIAEFKTMTGLTRKYAIPLLELLDDLGITRRKGSLREIL